MDLSFTYSHPVGSIVGKGTKNFTRSVRSFSLERGVNDAYQGEIEIEPIEQDVYDWVTNGHGRDVVAIAPNGNRIWRGFVEGVHVEMPGVNLDTTTASLANSVAVFATDPIVGDRITSLFYERQTSIDRYGTYRKVFDGGNDFVDNIERLAQSYLTRLAFPIIEKTFSDSDNPGTVIRLSLATYEKKLSYPYTYEFEDTETRKSKTIAILAGHPDGIFLPSDDNIEDDTFSFRSTEDNRSGLEIIQEMCDRGGSAYLDYTRRIFWVDNNLAFRLEPIPLFASYIRRRNSYLRVPFGQLDIWDIEPGKWLLFPDVNLGGDNFDLETSRQSMFIESVIWRGDREGSTVTPVAGEISTIKQIMAKTVGDFESRPPAVAQQQ